MRRWQLALMVALLLAAASPAAGRTRIDVSSPESVIADLRELAGRWTYRQFFEVLRATTFVRLPDYGESPMSFRQGPNRWSRVAEGAGLSILVAMAVPLYLAGDPFVDERGPERIAQLLHGMIAPVLEERTVEALVQLGREREQDVLQLLVGEYEDGLAELEQEVEQARMAVSRPGASREDGYRLGTAERRLDGARHALELMNRRLDLLETNSPFAPGASDCHLGEVMDRTTGQVTVADLATLAETCPQDELIAFLRAAAILAEVPAGLVHPGARMDPEALREVERRVASATRPIMWLAALFQLDTTTVFPTSRALGGVGSQSERIADVLRRGLVGRTASEMVHEAPRVEAGFLAALRVDYARRLEAELGSPGPDTQDPARPSRELKRLRAKIALIDRRLYQIGGTAGVPEP